jgi:2-C-methyl-D-erythritol 4-phosphate cytidylyltransferase
MAEVEVGAIIAAAGSGTRLGMGSKALIQLNGRTILARVVELFASLSEITQIVVAAPADRLGLARGEVESVERRSVPVHVCSGGETRQHSVRAGLRALKACDYVLVHDAARPLASADLVSRVLHAALRTGAAIPGLPTRDAVMRVESGRLVESLDRRRLMFAQTPQAFRYQWLERAHFEAADAGLIGDDDAQLVAASGHVVTVVEGEPTNIKLTTPRDFELVQSLLREQEAAGKP